MTKTFILALGILSIIVYSIIYRFTDQDNITTLSSDKSNAFIAKKVNHEADLSENTLRSITQSVQTNKTINTIKIVDSISDAIHSNVFLISGIAMPNKLPEYLLNTPFTTLDINYDSLSVLKTGDKFSIPLFSGNTLNLTVQNNSQQQNLSVIKGFISSGKLKLPASLSYRKGSILGSITTIDGEYRISKISGLHVIYKIPDLDGEPENDGMIVYSHPPH